MKEKVDYVCKLCGAQWTLFVEEYQRGKKLYCRACEKYELVEVSKVKLLLDKLLTVKCKKCGSTQKTVGGMGKYLQIQCTNCLHIWKIKINKS